MVEFVVVDEVLARRLVKVLDFAFCRVGRRVGVAAGVLLELGLLAVVVARLALDRPRKLNVSGRELSRDLPNETPMPRDSSAAWASVCECPR